MSLRTNFFIIVGVVVAFIIFVIVMLVRGGEEGAVVMDAANTPSATSSTGQAVTALPLPSPVLSVVPGVETLSRSFAERFGSFSNQSNFENLLELKPLMTAAMVVWADEFIVDSQKKAVKDAPYYGMTTRALQTKITAMDENAGTAKVVVKTQRREVKGRGAPKVFYQDLLLTLKKVGGEWKVEKATWQ